MTSGHTRAGRPTHLTTQPGQATAAASHTRHRPHCPSCRGKHSNSAQHAPNPCPTRVAVHASVCEGLVARWPRLLANRHLDSLGRRLLFEGIVLILF